MQLLGTARIEHQSSDTLKTLSLVLGSRSADDRTLPALPGVAGLPTLPEINVRSFASENMQPVLDALPDFAPTPSIDDRVAEASNTVSQASNTVAEGIRSAQQAVAPGVQSVSSALGPISQIRDAFGAALAPAVRHLPMQLPSLREAVAGFPSEHAVQLLRARQLRSSAPTACMLLSDPFAR